MSHVTMNPVLFAEFLRSPEGPVARHMIEVGEKVKQRTIASLKDGFPRDFLGPSIVKRVEMSDKGPKVTVGSEKVKTDAHPIEGNPVLVFEMPKNSGTVVFARHVNHPGSDFTEYLKKKLNEAVESLGGEI